MLPSSRSGSCRVLKSRGRSRRLVNSRFFRFLPTGSSRRTPGSATTAQRTSEVLLLMLSSQVRRAPSSSCRIPEGLPAPSQFWSKSARPSFTHYARAHQSHRMLHECTRPFASFFPCFTAFAFSLARDCGEDAENRTSHLWLSQPTVQATLHWCSQVGSVCCLACWLPAFRSYHPPAIELGIRSHTSH